MSVNSLGKETPESVVSGFDSLSVHAGQEFCSSTGAIVPPVYLASTFVQREVGVLYNNYEYSRVSNPTRSALEHQIAALEGGTHGFAYASGIAAEDVLLRALLRGPGHVLFDKDLYGGTHRLITTVHGEVGTTSATADLTNIDELDAALAATKTDVVWLETITNPRLRVADIRAVADVAHRHGATLVVDNTFATPALARPLTLGADVVVHSTTKYLSGHSDVIGGAVVTSDPDLVERLENFQLWVGAVQGPLDAWLVSRGIKTLGLRIERHSSNAKAVAEFLAAHPAIESVNYPALTAHPDSAVVQSQLGGRGGGVVSVALVAGADAAKLFAESTRVFQLAESLGGVESIIGYPRLMSHASLNDTEHALGENVVRISVGIESIDDLLADLAQALDRVVASVQEPASALSRA